MRHPAGNECQCVVCEEFFTSESAFYKHQVGTSGQVVCKKPEDVGLVKVSRAGGETWGYPPIEGAAAPWTPATRSASVELVFEDPFN